MPHAPFLLGFVVLGFLLSIAACIAAKIEVKGKGQMEEGGSDFGSSRLQAAQSQLYYPQKQRLGVYHKERHAHQLSLLAERAAANASR